MRDKKAHLKRRRLWEKALAPKVYVLLRGGKSLMINQLQIPLSLFNICSLKDFQPTLSCHVVELFQHLKETGNVPISRLFGQFQIDLMGSFAFSGGLSVLKMDDQGRSIPPLYSFNFVIDFSHRQHLARDSDRSQILRPHGALYLPSTLSISHAFVWKRGSKTKGSTDG
jgi:hypothetical protein